MKGHQRRARLKPARNLRGKKPGESLGLQGPRPSSESTERCQGTDWPVILPLGLDGLKSDVSRNIRSIAKKRVTVSSPLFHVPLAFYCVSDGCHGVDAGEDSCDWEEVVEAAVSLSKVPLAVQRVDEVDESIESSHGGIREGQIHQEVICHRPHAFVSQDNPDDNQIPKNGHCHHAAVSQRPQGNAPGRLHELIGEVAC
ncbi:hypothetical protein EK904_006211 [Melospiza melodia maxima]|nr:hypothetical protein EK904_006211 [Melospiza melodia maxima]